MKSETKNTKRKVFIIPIIIAAVLVNAILFIFFITAIIGFDLRTCFYSASSTYKFLSNNGDNCVGTIDYTEHMCKGVAYEELFSSSETWPYMHRDTVNDNTAQFVYAGKEYAYYTTVHDNTVQLKRIKYDGSDTELLYEYKKANSTVPKVSQYMIDEWKGVYPEGDHYILFDWRTKDTKQLSLTEYNETYCKFSVQPHTKQFINKSWTKSWTIKNEITGKEKQLTIKDLEKNEMYKRIQNYGFHFRSYQVDGDKIYLVFGFEKLLYNFFTVFCYDFDLETVDYIGWGDAITDDYSVLHFCVWDKTDQS